MIQQFYSSHHLTFQSGAKEHGRKKVSSCGSAPRHLQRGPGGVVRGGGRGVQGDIQRAGGTGEAGGQTQGPGAPGHARPDQSPRDSPAAPQTPGEHRWQKCHF